MQPALLASELTNSFTFLSFSLKCGTAGGECHVPIRLSFSVWARLNSSFENHENRAVPFTLAFHPRVRRI